MIDDRKHSQGGSMTAEEAGHLGGTAPHRCRGFQCQEEGSQSKKSSRSREEENE
jgi:hypothetical protein